MKTLNSVEVLRPYLPQVIALLKSHRVKKAYTFGSAVKGNFTRDSDIDFLITFEENIGPVEYGELYFDLAEKLEELLHRPVDLVTELSMQNPYFIKSVNETRLTLYE